MCNVNNNSSSSRARTRVILHIGLTKETNLLVMGVLAVKQYANGNADLQSVERIEGLSLDDVAKKAASLGASIVEVWTINDEINNLLPYKARWEVEGNFGNWTKVVTLVKANYTKDRLEKSNPKFGLSILSGREELRKMATLANKPKRTRKPRGKRAVAEPTMPVEA